MQNEVSTAATKVKGIPDNSSIVIPRLVCRDMTAVDRTVEKAVERGGKVLVPAQNQFWGDRTASIMDPAGHVWTVASRIEETTAQERSDRWSGILGDQKKS